MDGLRLLYRDVEAHNPHAVRRVAEALRAGMSRLRQNPQLGRRVRLAPNTWAPAELRDWVTGEYVARYLVLEEIIVILQVWLVRERQAHP